MSEGTPVASGNGAAGKPVSRTVKFVTGTVVAVAVAGLSIQLFRAWKSGDAAERPGTAQVAGAQRQIDLAAKVTRAGRSIQIPLKVVAEESMKRVGNEVIDSMVNRAVIQLACEEKGIAVTEAEVEQEIVRIANQFNIPPATWLEMLQSERNITVEQYSKDVIWPMLALKKLAGTTIEPSEEDMHKAFVRNYGPRVECRMIMLNNLRRADECWRKARLNPNDFDALVREYSDDPNTRAMGGAVPPIARYSGAPTIEKAAFSLKPGEISDVLNVGPNQYIVLKCEGHTEQVVKSIDEVREQLDHELREEKVQEAVAQLFEQLKATSRIDNVWAGTTSGDISQVSGQAAPAGASGVRPAAGQAAQQQAPGRLPASATNPAQQATRTAR